MMEAPESQGMEQGIAHISTQCEVISTNEVSSSSSKPQTMINNSEDDALVMNYNFSCSLCDKIFEHKQELVSHVCMHDPNVNVLYECQECKTLFQSLEGLAEHMKDHEKRKMVLKHNLKDNFMRLSYPCMFCDKILSSKGSLAKHQELHKGLRPYECTTCNKSFSLKGNLAKHMLIHLGEKPHQCGICEKTFTLKGNLQQHVLTHTGLKPFHCGKCGKAFTLKGNLDKHLKRHENGTLNRFRSEPDRRIMKSRFSAKRRYNDNEFDTVAEEEEMNEFEMTEEQYSANLNENNSDVKQDETRLGPAARTADLTEQRAGGAAIPNYSTASHRPDIADKQHIVGSAACLEEVVRVKHEGSNMVMTGLPNTASFTSAHHMHRKFPGVPTSDEGRTTVDEPNVVKFKSLNENFTKQLGSKGGSSIVRPAVASVSSIHKFPSTRGMSSGNVEGTAAPHLIKSEPFRVQDADSGKVSMDIGTKHVVLQNM